MELPVFQTDHTAEFNKFMQSEFPQLANEIPVPSTSKDLPLTVLLAMDNWQVGELKAMLFPSEVKALPVGVEMRKRAGTLEPQDASALRAAGLEHLAQQVEQLGQQRDDQRLADEALAGRKAYLAQQKAQKEFADLPLGHPLKAPSPESVQRFKEQHGITGRASWELDG